MTKKTTFDLLLLTTGCVFCGREEHSDGVSPCRPCPPSTAPNYGYQYQWWTAMPPNMAATCMSADGMFGFSIPNSITNACMYTDTFLPYGSLLLTAGPPVP